MQSETSEASENIKAGTLPTVDVSRIPSRDSMTPYATGQTDKKRQFPPGEDLLPNGTKEANETR